MTRTYGDILLSLYCDRRGVYLAKARLRSPDPVAEEAVQDVFSEAMHRGEEGSIYNAYVTSGEKGLHRVLCIACLRRAKDLQRPAYRLSPLDNAPRRALVHACNQEDAVLLNEVVELVPILAARATELAGNREPEKVAAGIADRLLGGMSDTGAAKTHGVRREPVQRGKTWVRNRLRVLSDEWH